MVQDKALIESSWELLFFLLTTFSSHALINFGLVNRMMAVIFLKWVGTFSEAPKSNTKIMEVELF